MSKYDPLYEYLRGQSLQQFVLSFAEIERIIGDQLPPSAARPQWWENATDPNSSHVQCRAWRAAGYSAYLVSGSNSVRFEKYDSE
ncbi:DUF7662 domain-containing protein [Bradyrhizobium viridifuturi]|uniref:DUF7662 domain-containing protein n=1 Tax=Bradyrhizobium viridifuturi TaxID=1654716 RepID=UPI000B9114A3